MCLECIKAPADPSPLVCRPIAPAEKRTINTLDCLPPFAGFFKRPLSYTGLVEHPLAVHRSCDPWSCRLSGGWRGRSPRSSSGHEPETSHHCWRRCGARWTTADAWLAWLQSLMWLQASAGWPSMAAPWRRRQLTSRKSSGEQLMSPYCKSPVKITGCIYCRLECELGLIVSQCAHSKSRCLVRSSSRQCCMSNRDAQTQDVHVGQGTIAKFSCKTGG